MKTAAPYTISKHTLRSRNHEVEVCIYRHVKLSIRIYNSKCNKLRPESFCVPRCRWLQLSYTQVRTLVACTSSITMKDGANQGQTKLQSQSFILLPLCIGILLRILAIFALKIYYHIGNSHLFYGVYYIHPLLILSKKRRFEIKTQLIHKLHTKYIHINQYMHKF